MQCEVLHFVQCPLVVFVTHNMLLHGRGQGYFLPLTLWGMVGFGIQPWGRIDQVLVHIYSQFQHETSHSPTSST